MHQHFFRICLILIIIICPALDKFFPHSYSFYESVVQSSLTLFSRELLGQGCFTMFSFAALIYTLLFRPFDYWDITFAVIGALNNTANLVHKLWPILF